MSKDKSAFIKFCSFIVLILAAVLILVNALVSRFGSGDTPAFLNILNLVKDVALLLGVAFGAYGFVQSIKPSARKVWTIIFWVSIAVYIAAAFFGAF